MSYEIYFVRRDPGQSFEDALDEIEESFDLDPSPLTVAEIELWDEVLPIARDVLGEVDAWADDATRGLTHPGTGIELTFFKGEMTIRVPYGDLGEGSVEVMAKVYELARRIENATGLEGYDPQLEEPVADARDRGAPSRGGAQRWDDGAHDDDDDDEPTGTSVTLPPARPRRTPEPAGGAPSDARWWEFWKR